MKRLTTACLLATSFWLGWLWLAPEASPRQNPVLQPKTTPVTLAEVTQKNASAWKATASYLLQEADRIRISLAPVRQAIRQQWGQLHWEVLHIG